MIRYRYVEQLTPPAPFVRVELRCVATDAKLGPEPAQIDTAADRTVLPERHIRALGLLEDDKIYVQGFGGQVLELPIYLVEVRIHDLTPIRVRVLLGPGEPHVLLGRDVVNAFPMLLDGPNLALEIQPGG